MTVHIAKSQLDYFRTRARKSRVEIYALLFGDIISDHEVRVVYFDYTKIEQATDRSVTPDATDGNEAIQMASEAGFSLLGSIHSHPGSPAYMSPCDLKSHIEDGDLVSGIVEVCGGRTRVAFWTAHSSVPCDVKQYRQPIKRHKKNGTA